MANENDNTFTDDLENFTGGCLCGEIRYESLEPPYNVGFCHCGMCRKAMGNLFGTWIILKRKDMHYVTREPDWYESSETVRRGFCAKCGSPIVYQLIEKDFDAVWIGSVDNPADYKPRAHWHTENKIAWVDILDHLPVKS